MSQDTIADDLLHSGYQRWLRLEEAKADISEDLKQLFMELKGNGLDTKALRVSFRRVRDADSAEVAEQEALVNLYVASLTRDTRVRARENIEEFGAETGEIIDPESEPASVLAQSSVTTPLADESVSREAVGAALPATSSPETATSVQASERSDAIETAGATAGQNPGGDHENAAHLSIESFGLPDAHNLAGNATDDMEVQTRPAQLTEEPGRSLASEQAPAESAADEISAPLSHAGLTGKCGEGASSSPAPSARLKTTDEVADDMGLPPAPHPLCRKPATCGRFGHVKLCPYVSRRRSGGRMMPELPYYIAAGAIGIVLIMLVLILLAAWAERHGKSSAHIDWTGGDEL